MNPLCYPGSELEIFQAVRHWKNYFSSKIRPHLGAQVLEVGAGLGATTKYLCSDRQQSWLCLEPDPQLAATLESAILSGHLPPICQARIGTLADLQASERFDAILYIDVLEHIRNDQEEMERAAEHLEEHGKLIVLAPAHEWLFTPFDKQIGHCRRYTKKTMSAVAPKMLVCQSLRYLDSVGLLASMANRFLLKSAMPTRRQLWFWDTVMVTLSRGLDPMLGYSLGKSLLGIWQKQARATA